jgi:hypothetical protein
VDHRQPTRGIGLVERQVDVCERDPVAVGGRVGAAADADRDHRPERFGLRLDEGGEPPQRPGDEREDDVVQLHAARRLDPLEPAEG